MSTGLAIGQEKEDETASTSLIAYVTNKTCASGCYHIVILNPRTREERTLTTLPNNSAYFGLAWRPHSDWLTFIYVEDNAHQLAMINTITEEIRPLGHGVNNLFDLAWSPDGNVLAFTALPLDKEMTVPLESDLFLYDAAVGITARFSQGVSTFSNIAWSPSGKTIAVDGKIRLPTQPREDDGYTDIFVFDRDGEFKIIGTPDVRDYSASWTKDGRYIIYASGDYVTQQIYKADLATQEITRLSNNADWKAVPRLVQRPD